MDYTQIQNSIKQKKPMMSEKSLSTYMINFKKLCNGMKITNLEELEDFDKVIEFISNETYRNKPTSKTTQKMRVASILNALVSVDENKFKDTIDKYRNKLFDFNKKIDKDITDRKGDLSEKDKNNYITFNDVKKTFNYYNKQIKDFDLNKKTKKTLTSVEAQILQKFLVISLYSLLPPRRNEYASVITVDLKDYKNESERDKQTKNYLIFINRDNKKLILNDFKTNTNGAYIRNITKKDTINKIFNLWRKFNKENRFLLKTIRGTQMSNNTLTKYLNILFRPVFPDKQISTSLLRKAFSTQDDKKEFKETFNKMVKDSDDMGHDIKTQLKYYNLNN